MLLHLLLTLTRICLITSLHFGRFVSRDKTTEIVISRNYSNPAHIRFSNYSIEILQGAKNSTDNSTFYKSSSITEIIVSNSSDIETIRYTFCCNENDSFVFVNLDVHDDYSLYYKQSEREAFNKSSMVHHRIKLHLKTRRRIMGIHSIVDLTHPPSAEYHKTLLSNFLPYARDLPRYEWPAIRLRSPCPTVTIINSNGLDRSKEVAIATAHTVIWDNFLRHHGESVYKIAKMNISDEDAMIIIFEQDAACTVSDCDQVAFETITESTADIVYLGWCQWQPKEHWMPPLCTQSYAVSLRGAKFLWETVDRCGSPVDVQMRWYGQIDKITWSAALDYRKKSKGQAISFRHYGDGIFGQKVF